MSSPDRATSEAPPNSVKTLTRGLDILQLFCDDSPELSQSEIAVRCGLPMPTVHRLVGTLVAREFLEPVAGGRRLRLGHAVLRLAGPLMSRRDPDILMRQKLHELSERTGETTNLATLIGASIVYIDGVTGSRLLTPQATIGARLPAHCTALGKALLAQLDDAEVKKRMGKPPYQQLTKHTAHTWSELKKRLDEVRERGIAISNEEYEIGLTSLALALPLQADGSQRALNISVPVTRATEEFRAMATDLLRQAVASVTA